MVTEYENLVVMFQFVTVDAGEAVYRQHTRVRELVRAAEKRPWPAFSRDAVEEWLRQVEYQRRLIAIDGSRGATSASAGRSPRQGVARARRRRA